MTMESIYEYGSRVGVWRLLRALRARELPLTVFGVAMALERNPDAVDALLEAGHEIACHGWRWIHYQDVHEATEREHMRARDATIHRRLTGERAARLVHRPRQPEHAPARGRARRLRVRQRLLRRRPAVLDDASHRDGAAPQLVVPYTLDANDMRFATPQGFNSGDQFFAYLRDAFDVLYAEGDRTPRMMSVGMHCRLLGRPGRLAALQRFLDHVARHDGLGRPAHRHRAPLAEAPSSCVRTG